ncbi:murein biosynthesis integral membrane protein MurJ [soil metagenome]
MTARTIAKAGLIVTAAFFLSRILGWVRLVVITNIFGAQADLDAYFAAFRVPYLLFQLVAAGALSSALIPILAGLFARDEEPRAWRVVSTVLNVLMIGLLGLSLVVAVFAPQIVPLVTPGFDLVNTELTVRLTRIMLLSPVLLALGAVASSVLNSRNRFGAAATAPIFYNVAIIIAAIFLAPLMGIDALAVGTVVGSLLHLFVQLPALRGERFRLSFDIDLGDPAARQALLLMAPRAIGLGAGQLTFMVNTMLATGIGVGAVTAYNVAFTILQIPLGVIAMPLGVVIFPALSRAVAQGSMREFGALIVRSMRLLLYVMLFFTAVGIVLRRQAVALLFDFGFDDRALDLTANTLSFMLIGLAGHSLVIILARSFYAGQDTRTPVLTAVAEVIVSITVALATVGALGLSGLGLGLATGAWFEVVVLSFLLWRRTPGAGLERLLRPIAGYVLGAILAGLVALFVVRMTEMYFGLDPGKLAQVVQLILAGGAAALAYAAYSWVTRIPELHQTIDLLRSLMRRGGTQA